MFIVKHKLLIGLLGAMILLGLPSCSPDDGAEGNGDSVEYDGLSGDPQEIEGPQGCVRVVRQSLEKVGNGMVELRPAEAKYQGDILVLPAWGDPRDTWCHRSSFCSMAQGLGFRLIFPDMGKSIYTSQHYAETREDWRSYPTYAWLRDTLIPELQSRHCLLEDKGNNFVIGMSAGARGAIRLAQDLPDIFMAAAALSGDYDPGQMKGDNIYRGFLGAYDKFPERWEVNENIVQGASKLRSPIFLAHGKDDPLVPYDQSEALYKAIQASNPGLAVKLNLVSGQMDGYEFWNSQIEQILAFFEDTQANRPETP